MYPFQRFSKHAAGAGCIDALETFACRAEDSAVVQPEAGLIYNEFFQFGIGKSQSAAIQPQQVRSFRFDQTDLRNMLLQKRPGKVYVLTQILFYLLQPGKPILIRRFTGNQPQRIQLAVTRRVDFMPDLSAQFIVGNKNV